MEKLTARTETGFSLIEVLFVVAFFVIILAFATPNLFNPLGREKVGTLSNDIVSNLRDAQTKAMSSETFGKPATSEFGVHFGSNNYIIFRGTIFDPTDSDSFLVDIPTGLTVNPNLPCNLAPNDCNNIVFSKLSGEVQNFDQTKNSLCLSDSLNNRILITINFLGVTNVQQGGC